jgi:16S rRNA (guanine527-N7)-methyltransferase
VTDRDNALRLCGFSDDAVRRLDIFEAVLRKWQETINLVAPSTLDFIWTRHFADSWQVGQVVSDAKLTVDLGSGGGFPGVVLGILAVETEGSSVHLVESDQRKAAFLREVSRETGAKCVIHMGRIEAVCPRIKGNVDVVSARALAPLAKLLEWSKIYLDKGAVGVFLKGQDVASELTLASMDSRFSLSVKDSLTDPRAKIIIARSVSPRF